MVIPFLGVAFLVTMLFPIGEQIILPVFRAYFGEAFRGWSALQLQMLLLAMTYLTAFIVTAWFFAASDLKRRIPPSAPGTALLACGVVLTTLYLGARIVAATIEGGGGSYMVAMLSPFVLLPARVLLVVGVARLLLAAAPRTAEA